MSNQLNIGLFGFGCVGQGLYHVLNNSTGFKANISRIGVKDRSKKRIVDADLITYDKWEILNDKSIDVVVELIDDADEAFSIVSEAIRRRKHVVTANKKLLAKHLDELLELQEQYNVSLLYEGAVCGSIPIIRTLEEYFDNEILEKVTGIFNGTSNYILSKTINEKISYENALYQAQARGFAETDPTSDVEGFDPKFKAVILALHAFGLIIPEREVFNLGITTLDDNDVRYAAEKGLKIKLTPVIQRLEDDRISAFVLPRFVKNTDPLFNVENEVNGVIVQGRFSGEQFLQGKGAGSLPTGAAVLSDISALSYVYGYEYKKKNQKQAAKFTNDVIVEVYLRYGKRNEIEDLNFTSVTEQYSGGKYNYIVGKVKLKSLIENREQLLNNRIFVSLLNDKVELDRESGRVRIEKVLASLVLN